MKDLSKEERLWEVQRILTALKRKLREAKRQVMFTCLFFFLIFLNSGRNPFVVPAAKIETLKTLIIVFDMSLNVSCLFFVPVSVLLKYLF